MPGDGLSFPPVSGFRQWSQKQDNQPPGASFQAGGRLKTTVKAPLPQSACDELKAVMGDKLYTVYCADMGITIARRRGRSSNLRGSGCRTAACTALQCA